jgi:hypothetical protein
MSQTRNTDGSTATADGTKRANWNRVWQAEDKKGNYFVNFDVVAFI